MFVVAEKSGLCLYVPHEVRARLVASRDGTGITAAE